MALSNEQLFQEVRGFVEWLYESRTINYALNHGCMEYWVALEGLEYFASQGWSCWETVGLITSAPVHSKKKEKPGGIKLPDLVCVRDGVSLWWEFKAVSRLALHPENAVGTLPKDVRALVEFERTLTLQYLAAGTLPLYRDRDDSANIDASGLKDALAGGENLGVALLFLPGDDQVSLSQGRTWQPSEVVETIGAKIADICSTATSIPELPRGTPAPGPADTDAQRGSPSAAGRPRCAGWLVPMEG